MQQGDASSNPHRFAVHGLAVSLACNIGFLEEQIEPDLGTVRVPEWPAGFTPVSAVVRPYDDDVLKSLAPAARRISPTGQLIEFYQDQERFWIIDERCGLCEINLLKSQWRSWILPHAASDPVACASFAILWP